MPKSERQVNCRCFSEARDHGFETIPLGVRALNGSTFPVQSRVQVRVFDVLASAGTRVRAIVASMPRRK